MDKVTTYAHREERFRNVFLLISVPTSLERLNLDSNSIDEIESNTFADKPSLVSVTLKSNQITKLDMSSISVTPKPKGKTILI